MPAETAAPDRRRGPLGLLARIGTEGLAPAVVVTVLVFGTSWHATGAALPALGWGALAAVFGAAVPMAAILYGVRAGAWTDRHVRRREQRRLPLAVCLGSTAAGTLLMWAAARRAPWSYWWRAWRPRWWSPGRSPSGRSGRSRCTPWWPSAPPPR
ncbi:hypothetical protein ACFQXA_11210 [Nocardiopsis composta]